VSIREKARLYLQFSEHVRARHRCRAAQKRSALLATASGRIIGEARGGGANLQAAGELEVEKVLHHVMDAAIGDRDVRRRRSASASPASIARPIPAAVHGIMRRIGFKAQVIVVNDALVALVAGAGEGEGVVVVAGPGSIRVRPRRVRAARARRRMGIPPRGRRGGFWIGRAALTAVVRQFDGRGRSRC
jgi:N-acetylglucosamine kinase-like BadF-type ATPase